MYFSGIQPTGKMHIGNYLGAVRNWVKLQQPGNQNIYCIVDLHALTDKLTIDHEIKFDQNTKSDTLSLAATLIASGINPQQSVFFVQSHVPEHAELQWILSCIAPKNWLNKMTQYKDKKKEYSTLGLYTYPLLMAADIILYQAQYVPVGLDQKQHIELTRDYVQRLNSLFKLNIVEPQYLESTCPKIMSLRDGNKKMSKSDAIDGNRINIDDSKEEIFEKIKRSKTDSIPQIYFDQDKRPEISNLLRIYQAFSNLSMEQVIEKYLTKTTVDFKRDLSELIANELNTIAQKKKQILNNQSELEQILKEGSMKAREIASKNLKLIKENIGLLV
ncbi:unnamed protein product [Paramecium octaurelia]|uniref:tryptophan--tRNA ligase n=1 Tax=Paramecium octaurelia TaxID=43137 RepID=A0A8S1VYP7_PAROT|nr:unnamed protein product [Paramecium octaurelia]